MRNLRSSERCLTPSVFLRDVLPLGAGVLLSALYFRIDLFFIERWHGLEPVGAYNAVFRLVEAMRLLPAAVMAVTFPLLVQTRRHATGPADRRMRWRSPASCWQRFASPPRRGS